MEGTFVGHLNAQRLYETTARIMGERYNVKIMGEWYNVKITVTVRPKVQEERMDDVPYVGEAEEKTSPAV